MNGNPHEQHERHREAADPPDERPEPGEKAGTPDAVEAAHVRRDGDQGTPGHESRARPTDLIARYGATLSARGIDFEAELARRARAPIANRLHDLADRARRLPPLSAFGRRGATPEGAGAFGCRDDQVTGHDHNDTSRPRRGRRGLHHR